MKILQILMRQKFFVVLLLTLLIGCANVNQLRTGEGLKVTGPSPDSIEEYVQYEVATIGGIEVGFHIDHFRQGQVFGGYRLTLLLLNDSTEFKTVAPSVKLLDRTGFEVPPDSYPLFMATLKELGAATSTYSPKQNGTRYFSGQAASSIDGSIYNFSGTSRLREDQGTSFARGADEVLVAVKRKTGMKLASWGARNWLLEKYDLSPKTKTVGVVFFNSLQPRSNPLELILTVNGETKRINLKQ